MAATYKINLRRAHRDLVEGDLVIVKGAKRNYRNGRSVDTPEIGTVVTSSPKLTLIDFPVLGRLEAVKPAWGGEISGNNVRGIDIVAVNHLKTTDLAVIADYYARAMDHYSERPVVFHVDAVDEHGFSGRIVTEDDAPSVKADDLDGGDVNPADDEPSIFEATSNDHAFVSKRVRAVMVTDKRSLDNVQALPTVSKGDVLITYDTDFRIIDGVETARLTEPAVIGNMATIDEVVAFLDFQDTPFGHFHRSELAYPSFIARELDLAHARTEPDQALVFVYMDDPSTGREPRESVHLLASSGYHALINDCLIDYLDGKDFGTGLWLLDDLKNVAWGHGEDYDADVEFSQRPATREDVERLLGDVDDACGEMFEILSEAMDVDSADGLVDKFIEQAQINDFEEKFTAEHKVFAAARFGLSVRGEGSKTFKTAFNRSAVDALVDEALENVESRALREFGETALKEHLNNSDSAWFKLGTGEYVFDPAERDRADVRHIAETLRTKVPEAEALHARRYGKYGKDSYAAEIANLSKRELASNLRDFSEARQSKGTWKYLSHVSGHDVTLALVVEGKHVATLVSCGERSRLYHTNGLSMSTHPHVGIHGAIPGHGGNMLSLLLDADRAVCEVEARREITRDFLAAPVDGVHEVGGAVYHVLDGVLHRADGPAVENPTTGYREWRFRGNLHRDEGPALTQGDQAVWYRHGLEHRVDGPSTVIGDEREYRQYDKLHREDGPAIDKPWFKEFCIEGRRHREDGPALINANEGLVEWRRGNLLHREDGPAFESGDGSLGWFKNNMLHNMAGPAWRHPVEGDAYAVDGVEMTEANFHAAKQGKEMTPC